MNTYGSQMPIAVKRMLLQREKARGLSLKI
jgi:hypothetical protein